MFSHSHYLCSHGVIPHTQVPTNSSHTPTHTQSVLTHTLTLLVLSHQLFSNSSHSHMLSLILSHRVFSLILSHYLFSHTNSFTLSHQLFSLTHVIPDTLSLSVLTLLSHTHHTHNDLSSTSHYTLVAPLDPPYHPNQFNQEDGINLKDSLDKASSYPHSTHSILSRLQKIAKTIPFHSIPYKSFSFTQKESSILT